MHELKLLQEVGRRGSNKEELAEKIIVSHELLPFIFEGLNSDKGPIKFGCQKILLLISEKKPELIYPNFNFFVKLLESKNKIIKWGAIIIIANLAKVDSKNKFDSIFKKYYSIISEGELISAANVISSSVRIISGKPALKEKIAENILKVEKAVYETAECHNIAVGHALKFFENVFNKLSSKHKEAAKQFALKELKNSRPAVRKEAARFLKKFSETVKNRIEIINVTEKNINETGFFCYMSSKKKPGYQQKMKWLSERFKEGLKIKMLKLPERGFIEYIPGEFAWRAVNAKGYLFIHCLWVVGKSKSRGFANMLLDLCIKDAKIGGFHGVAMLASEGNWLAGKDLLLKKGFVSVQASPPFELMVKKFDSSPSPVFTDGWQNKIKNLGNGLTIIRSSQCPYLDDAVNTAVETSRELGIKSKILELKTAEDIRKFSPSPYGSFAMVYNGRLISYHYLLKKDLVEKLTEFTKSESKN
jgi:hypothetical protein